VFFGLDSRLADTLARRLGFYAYSTALNLLKISKPPKSNLTHPDRLRENFGRQPPIDCSGGYAVATAHLLQRQQTLLLLLIHVSDTFHQDA
jgi:hypothetical protein